MDEIDISLIVPVYNEEFSIAPFLERVESVFNLMCVKYEIIFALDPSDDNTELVIRRHIDRNNRIKLLVFTRRFGQPAATIAGISAGVGRFSVVIDVDLQDPPELIKDMYFKIFQGYEVVYAKRRSRRGETLTKRFITYLGYYLINKLSDIKIPRDTGDFRIMSRRVVDDLLKLNEGHGFLRGLVAFVGYKQDFVEYERDERLLGSGKYSRLFGSLKIGLNGLISFSSKPLFIMSISGFVLALFGFLLGGWYFLQKLIGFELTPGLSTTVLLITFFAGIQLLGLGLIGEYVGRIYDEVKRRPMYIVDRKVNFGEYE